MRPRLITGRALLYSIVAGSGAIAATIAALAAFRNNPDVQIYGCWTLRNVTTDEAAQAQVP